MGGLGFGPILVVFFCIYGRLVWFGCYWRSGLVWNGPWVLTGSMLMYAWLSVLYNEAVSAVVTSFFFSRPLGGSFL